jgi:hypothetical protein
MPRPNADAEFHSHSPMAPRNRAYSLARDHSAGRDGLRLGSAHSTLPKI